MELMDIKTEMLTAAKTAADEFFSTKMSGKDWGACGFAWVTVNPAHKGNTKLGRAERVKLRELGFELDWTGKSFQYWNPSQHPAQNIDTKEAGARAAAAVLRKHGFAASAGSRLD
jgi:phospholipase/lecithinase/hemolysin